jgi:hypothetical protein
MTKLTPETKPATTERGFCLGVSSTREKGTSKFQPTPFLRKVKLKHDFSQACMAKYLSE